MCSVVARWSPGEPVLILALRDEIVGRKFDDPGHWWPGQPAVVGGRDHQGGGTWCATDVASGDTALVLNRTQRPIPLPGAPSRGVLPLLAVQHGPSWPDHVDFSGMASFALILASPSEGVTQWEFDGKTLVSSNIPPGTHMFTAGVHEEGRAARHLHEFAAAESRGAWQTLVTHSLASEDPAALLVKRPYEDGSVFATVFAQIICVEPESLLLSFTRDPSEPEGWRTCEERASACIP